MFRVMAVFYLFMSSFGQGMSKTLCDDKAIFSMWVLSQKQELIKEVKNEIIQRYIETKRLQCRFVRNRIIQGIDITVEDLILLPDNYIKGFYQLNGLCLSYSRYGHLDYCSKEDYELVCNLPKCLKDKFKIFFCENNHDLVRRVFVIGDGIKEIFSED